MSGRRVALIVANYNYSDPALRRLVAPAEDAESFARVLEDPEIGNFEIQVLVNEPHYLVKHRIASLFHDLTRGDFAVLYFSGHGLKDQAGNLYLATVDTDHKFPQASAVEDRFVRSQMDESRSQSQILILDCCYSGAFAKGMVHRGDERIGTAEHFHGRGQVVLAASDAMQYAFEGDQVSGEGIGSVFTGTLVEGLQTGEADLDHNGDISVNELFDFAHQRVRVRLPQQTPIMSAIGAQGQLIIARNPRPRLIPADLPPELQEAKTSPNPTARLGAVEVLEELLQNKNRRMALAADLALRELADDDSKRVSARASETLANQHRRQLAGGLAAGRRAYDAGEWAEAIRQLDAVVSIDAGYEDALALLEEARQRRDLDQRYAEATRLHARQEWQNVLDVVAQIRTIAPEYPDPNQLETSARVQLEEQELNTLYRQALHHVDSQEWDAAIEQLETLQRRRPGYRDVPLQLTRVRQSLIDTSREHMRPVGDPVAENQSSAAPRVKVARPDWKWGVFTEPRQGTAGPDVAAASTIGERTVQRESVQWDSLGSVLRRFVTTRPARLIGVLAALIMALGTFLPWLDTSIPSQYFDYQNDHANAWELGRGDGPKAPRLLFPIGIVVAAAIIGRMYAIALIGVVIALVIEVYTSTNYGIDPLWGAKLTIVATLVAGIAPNLHLLHQGWEDTLERLVDSELTWRNVLRSVPRRLVTLGPGRLVGFLAALIMALGTFLPWFESFTITSDVDYANAWDWDLRAGAGPIDPWLLFPIGIVVAMAMIGGMYAFALIGVVVGLVIEVYTLGVYTDVPSWGVKLTIVATLVAGIAPNLHLLFRRGSDPTDTG